MNKLYIRWQKETINKALKKANVKKAYDALKDEFDLLDIMLNARLKSGKTQSEVAKKMNTTTSVVGRLETGGGKLKHSPTIETLRNYARAVNCHLEIKLTHSKSTHKLAAPKISKAHTKYAK